VGGEQFFAGILLARTVRILLFLQFSKKTERQQISVVAQLQLSAGKLFSPWGLRQDKRIEFHRRTVVSNNRALLSFCCPWFTEWRLKAALRCQNGG
jgi:hypothetical protein